MNPREVLCTTAAVLVFGLVSVAGSQPGQQAPEAGSAKHRAEAAQPQKQTQQDQAPAKNQKQRPAVQNRRQRPAAVQGRQVQPAPSMSNRQGPAQNQPQSQRPTAERGRYQAQARSPQRPTAQRPQYQAPARNPQQRPVAATRDRTPLPRRAIQPQVQSRTSVSRVEQQAMWPRYRARSWSSQHRTWVQRGGYNGYRIPGPQFSLYFGRPHRFHLSTYQVRVVGAYPEFYTDGYWFTMLDPVPEYWGNDWYDTDYCSVVESDGGYYLMNEAYPRTQISVSIRL